MYIYVYTHTHIQTRVSVQQGSWNLQYQQPQTSVAYKRPLKKQLQSSCRIDLLYQTVILIHTTNNVWHQCLLQAYNIHSELSYIAALWETKVSTHWAQMSFQCQCGQLTCIQCEINQKNVTMSLNLGEKLSQKKTKVL